MSEFAVRRPVTIIMICLGIVVLGIIAAGRTPIQLMPDMKSSKFLILSELRGASSEEIESGISIPIERNVATVSGLVRTHSISTRERSEVHLEFRPDVNELETIGVLREKLDSAGITEGASRPRIVRGNSQSQAVLKMAFVATDKTSIKAVAERVREDFAKSIEKIPGVALALVLGAPEDKINIDLNTTAILSFGINPSSIAPLIQAQGKTHSLGQIFHNGEMVGVQIREPMLSIEELNQLVILKEGPKTVRLGDISKISKKTEVAEVQAKWKGQAAIVLEVFREAESNAIEVAKNLLPEFDEFLRKNNTELAGGVLANQGEEIKNSVDGVISAVMNGGILTAFLIYIFLQAAWPTFVVSLVIPISLLFTLILIYFSGVSYNLMSLAGLALGVGMLVDNAIVVMENIKYQRTLIDDAKEAAIWGTKKVTGAIITSTLSNVAVFGPLIFVEGPIGEIFKDISYAVVYSNLASLVVSLLLVPMLCGSQDDLFTAFRRKSKSAQQSNSDWLHSAIESGKIFLGLRFFSRLFTHLLRVIYQKTFELLMKALTFLHERVFSHLQTATAKEIFRLEAALKRLLPQMMKRSGMTLLGIAAVWIISLAGFLHLGTELFPDAGNLRFLYELEFPTGSESTNIGQEITKLEQAILVVEGVRSLAVTTGEKGPHYGQIEVLVTEGQGPRVHQEISKILHGTADLRSQRIKTNLIGNQKPVQVEIYSEDLKTLSFKTQELVKQLQSMAGFTDIETSIKPDLAEISIDIKKAELNFRGLDSSSVLGYLKSFLDRKPAGTMTLEGQSLPIEVNDSRAEFKGLDSLKYFSLPLEDRRVFLSQVSEVRLVSSPARIDRIDRKRVATVSADLDKLDMGTAENRLKENLRKNFSTEVKWKMGPQNEQKEKSDRSLMLAVLMSLFLIYLILASQFESFTQPMIILFAVPLCLIGVSAFLLAAQLNVSAMVFVGFIILVGTAVNSSIVIVDSANQFMKRGLSPEEAVIKATVLRLKPIIMTSLSGIIGLLPLALKLGEGSSAQQPMALTIIGGLLSSTLLSLFAIPVIYKVLIRNEVTKSYEEK